MQAENIEPSLEGQYILEVEQSYQYHALQSQSEGVFNLTNVNSTNAITYYFSFDSIPKEQKEIIRNMCLSGYDEEEEIIFLGQKMKCFGLMESNGSRENEYLYFKNMSNGKDFTMCFGNSLVFRVDIINDELVNFITQYCKKQAITDIWRNDNENIFLISPPSRVKSARSILPRPNEDDNPSPKKKQKTN